MEEFTHETTNSDTDMSQLMLDDLQLAAELGKTLLERNKELEILLKEHKTSSEEHKREIVHLRKQINAMSEVNDSRLKVYEQLEVGIQDLERTNHRLNVDKTRDKKQIKTLSANLETLEARCEELNKQLEESRQMVATERRKIQRLQQERDCKELNAKNVNSQTFHSEQKSPNCNVHEDSDNDFNRRNFENNSFAFEQCDKANSTGVSDSPLLNENSTILSLMGRDAGDTDNNGEDNEELLNMISDLESTKRAFAAEQQRCVELEEQLVAIIQENQTLQSRLVQTSSNEEMMSMHDEFSLLDDVRQGQMCSRCLRAVDDRTVNNDDQSSVAPTEEVDEEDERSLLGLESRRDGDQGSEFDLQPADYTAEPFVKLGSRAPDYLDLSVPASPNPYRDLVMKYEALLEVQRSSLGRKHNGDAAGHVLFADEFQARDKQLFQTATTEISIQSSEKAAPEANNTSTGSDPKAAAPTAAKSVRESTPTQFSEAETFSSGFSDETSNKYTQTDERPGYFLCSIGDGEDCKFSIYDDVSPIDSHFRNRPEYRDLFKEIFSVLKKAAENKEEGDKLPLLDDDLQPVEEEVPITAAKVPPVTPANEQLPIDFADDTQSIISSAVSEQSLAMSECITKLERKTARKQINDGRIQENRASKVNVMLPVANQHAQTGSTTSVKQIIENGRVLTPLKREPLEYLTVGVGIKKKNRRKNRGMHIGTESPLAQPSPTRACPGSGGSNGRRTRKDFQPLPAELFTPEPNRLGRAMRHRQTPSNSSTGSNWNGSPMIIYNRNLSTPRGREFELNGVEYRPNTVSQELDKLKRLDLSYAEVLRRAEGCEHHNGQQQRAQPQRRRHGNNNYNNSHHHYH